MNQGLNENKRRQSKQESSGDSSYESKDFVNDPSYELDVGQRIVALVSNKDLLQKLGQTAHSIETCQILDIIPNHKAKGVEDGLLIELKWTDTRKKEHKDWITNLQYYGDPSDIMEDEEDITEDPIVHYPAQIEEADEV